MAKRAATSELNHENWEREDEPEEAGSFVRASNEALRTRVIKTAKRRNPISSMANVHGDSQPSAFSSFQGFGKTAAAAAPNFNFLSGLTNTPKVNGTSEPVDTTKVNSTENKSAMLKSNDDKKDTNGNPQEYYAKLKGLNESVAKWISKHVQENPLINLEPVFKDYKKYFDELEKTKVKKSSSSETKAADVLASKSSEAVTSKTSEPTFSFGTGPPSTTSLFAPASSDKPTFSFGSANNAPKTTAQSPGNNFSFASTISTTSSAGGFSFSGATPFSFSSAPKPQEQKDDANKNADNDDEDEPPKVEYNPVMEDDHIYTIKCKLFIKKGENYGAGSVGNMFLKKVANSEKTQLIVRADTNLGNILCNFILTESVPCKRLGKKDVMLVCMPLPDSKPPPTPILLRVKTPEDADLLLETLEKHKK